MRLEADEAPDAAMNRKVMECMPGILRSRDSQDIIHQRPHRLRQPNPGTAPLQRPGGALSWSADSVLT